MQVGTRASWTGAAAGVLTALSSCASPEPGGYHALINTPEGIVRLDLRRSPRLTGPHRYLIDARRGETQVVHRFCGGMSGSPVFGPEGLLGGLTYPKGSLGRGLTVAPIHEITKWAAFADHHRRDDCVPLPASVELRPGESVASCSIWGDLHVGDTGAVTCIRGSRCYMFSHGSRAAEDHGAHRALVRIHPLAFVRPRSSAKPRGIYRFGELIGLTYFHGARGSVGAIGLGPPHARLEIRHCDADGAERNRLTLCLALPENRDVLAAAVARACAALTPSGAQFTLRRSGPDQPYWWLAARSQPALDHPEQLPAKVLDAVLRDLFAALEAGISYQLDVTSPPTPARLR